MEELGRCSKCAASISASHPYAWCSVCGEPLPSGLIATLKEQARIPASNQQPRVTSSGDRDTGVGIGIAGAVLLLLGALRWNSMGSQLVRAMGESDVLGFLLLTGGMIGIGWGLYLALPMNHPQQVVTDKPRSVEQRLQQLEDLRAKELISEEQYQGRKQEIVSSL